MNLPEFLEEHSEEINNPEKFGVLMQKLKEMAIKDIESAETKDECIKAKNRWIGRNGVMNEIFSVVMSEE